jgi:hypothetical protein
MLNPSIAKIAIDAYQTFFTSLPGGIISYKK